MDRALLRRLMKDTVTNYIVRVYSVSTGAGGFIVRIR